MRYHYNKPDIYLSKYGEIYECNHPVYNICTLFKINKKGLAIIQQRFNPDTKNTYWDAIDPWLNDDLYLHPNFYRIFKSRASECQNELYPTMTVRQLMWALKMKPMRKEQWETCFDRKDI